MNIYIYIYTHVHIYTYIRGQSGLIDHVERGEGDSESVVSEFNVLVDGRDALLVGRRRDLLALALVHCLCATETEEATCEIHEGGVNESMTLLLYIQFLFLFLIYSLRLLSSMALAPPKPKNPPAKYRGGAHK